MLRTTKYICTLIKGSELFSNYFTFRCVTSCMTLGYKICVMCSVVIEKYKQFLIKIAQEISCPVKLCNMAI